MNKRINSKSFYCLLAIYILAVWLDIANISEDKMTSDFVIYDNLHIGFLFLPIQGILLAINLLTLFYLLRTDLKAVYFGISSLLLSFFTTTVGFLFTLMNLEFMKEFYQTSRAARGVLVQKETLDLFFSTQAILLMGVVALLWYTFVGWLLFNIKRQILKSRMS